MTTAPINTVKIGFTSGDVKDALRRHHPAYEGPSGMPWTCVEEWCNIDLLAIECWQQARVIGYEVKISRSNYRAELLDPTKRAEAVSRTTQFYMATPAGLLKPEEIAFEEPEWGFEDFVRPRCDNQKCYMRYRPRGFMHGYAKPRGARLRGTDREGESISFGHGREAGVHPDGGTYSFTYDMRACCLVCRGYGTKSKSRVELESPVTLWVPRDVGLVEISTRGVKIVKVAPKRKTPRTILGKDIPIESENLQARRALSQLARWVSVRPDPRHRAQ